MRKRIIFISSISLCLALTVFLSSFITWRTWVKKYELGNHDMSNFSINRILSKIPEPATAQNYYGNTYFYDEFDRRFCIENGGYHNNYFSSINWSLGSLHSSYPISYIRLIDDDNILVVYRFINANAEIFFVYIFMDKDKLDSDAMKNWYPTGRVLYASKRLSYSDMSTISVGDTIETVTSIDPTTKLSVGTYEIDSQTVYYSHHVLTDGICRVEYKKNENGEKVVTDLQYNSDYSIWEHNIYNYERICHILPEELPS